MIEIKVGIIGAGANTCEKHIPLLREQEGVEIVAVCNRSLESTRKVAKAYDIPEACHNWAEVIGNPEVEAVVIGTWPNMHRILSCSALSSGKHVLCEARMAMNLDEAMEMLETSRLYPELVAQIVPAPFTFAYDQIIQEKIAEGFLGELLAIDLRSHNNSFPDYAAPLNWRQDKDLSGNNIMMMGIWYESLARWVGHAKRVTAMGAITVKTRPDKTGKRIHPIRIPDHLDIICEMHCGAQARMQFSAVSGYAGPQNTVSLYGSEGTLHLDLDSGILTGGRRKDKSLKKVAIPKGKQGSWRVEEEFINAIRGKEEVKLTTFSDACKYMAFTEAVNQSMQSGEAIDIP